MKQDAVPGYAEWLHSLARRYRASQIKAALAVNSEMLKFYWSLGADIVRLGLLSLGDRDSCNILAKTSAGRFQRQVVLAAAISIICDGSLSYIA